MKIKTFYIIVVLLASVFTLGYAQEKKVAVATFYANKYISTEDLSGAAANVATVAALAKDPNFNLTPILDKFHKSFFENYKKNFPFEVIDESNVTGNEKYKEYVTRDTSSIFLYNTLVREGYNLYAVSALYKKDLAKMIEIFPDVDGFMFIELSFSFVPKLGIGGMGTAGISANAVIRFWNNDEKRVLNIFEGAVSKGSVPMVAGFPVIKVEEILPLCEDATNKLLQDLEKKLPKIIKKSTKKL